MLSLLIVAVLFLVLPSFKATTPTYQTVLEPTSETLRPSDGELIFGIVLFRHGHRNIKKYNYSNDPYQDEIHWPEGFGQLTKRGTEQLFELGKFYRRRYGALLGDKYSPKRVYVRSSDVDRTIMSALSCLAGLFPPADDESWNESIKWQPIPVHTVPLSLDYALCGPRYCPTYRTAHAKFQEDSPEVQRIYKEHADKFAYWSEMCGKNVTTISDVYNLYNTLFIESVENKTLANWAQAEIKSNGIMEYIASYHLKMASGTKLLARLQSGFLLKEIFQHLGQKINATLQLDRSLWMYSAHDYTVSSLLNSLGLFEMHIPPFSASLHLELYKVGEAEHCIQIFYRKSNEEDLTPMKIRNCDQKCCTLERLHELFGDIIPGDHDVECGLKNTATLIALKSIPVLILHTLFFKWTLHFCLF